MIIDKALTTSGERLRRARVLAGLTTRREFEKKHSISANTLQGWEQGKNPLSEKGAKRVVEAFKWEGLLCSVDWLIHGTGMPPRPYDMLNAGVKGAIQKGNILSEQHIREEENIYQEAQLFKEQNINSMVLTIADDAMEPSYSIGDYVGAVRVYGDEIKRFIGNVCIIELENNVIVPRLLQEGPRDGTYNICAINPRTTASPLNCYGVHVMSAAPILWHRRKISSLPTS